MKKLIGLLLVTSLLLGALGIALPVDSPNEFADPTVFIIPPSAE